MVIISTFHNCNKKVGVTGIVLIEIVLKLHHVMTYDLISERAYSGLAGPHNIELSKRKLHHTLTRVNAT